MTTEREDLQQLVHEGFQPLMILRTVPQGEKRARLPKPYWDKEVRALPLHHENGQKRMFYMIQEETITYAKKLVEDARTIIGYDLWVYCSAIGEDFTEGRQADLKKVIESLADAKNWKVCSSEYPNSFEVHFDIDSGDERILAEKVRDVRNAATMLSLKNRAGFVVEAYSPGPRYKGQRFSIKIGVQQRNLDGIDEHDFISFERIFSNDDCMEAAKALQAIYSQTTERSRMILIWATLEDMFDNKTERLLSKKEISLLQEHVYDLDIDDTKLDRIMGIVRSFNTKRSRNERIAKNIAEKLDYDYKSTVERVRSMASARGKLAHSVDKREDVEEHLRFVEELLHSYIRMNCGIVL